VVKNLVSKAMVVEVNGGYKSVPKTDAE
jgi:hypothetical protein